MFYVFKERFLVLHFIISRKTVGFYDTVVYYHLEILMYYHARLIKWYFYNILYDKRLYLPCLGVLCRQAMLQ